MKYELRLFLYLATIFMQNADCDVGIYIWPPDAVASYHCKKPSKITRSAPRRVMQETKCEFQMCSKNFKTELREKNNKNYHDIKPPQSCPRRIHEV